MNACDEMRRLSDVVHHSWKRLGSVIRLWLLALLILACTSIFVVVLLLVRSF